MEDAIKRSNIRYLIDLEVKVETNGKPPLRCRVRDYCLSGMFLTLLREGDAPPITVPLARNEPITVEFTALNGKRQRIAAQVAHIVAGGFGLRFTTVSDEVLNALLDIASQQQTRTDQGPALAGDWQSQGRSGLMLLLKDTLQRHMVGLFNTFHETLVDLLFERASRPRDTKEQNQMFEALDYLNRGRTASFQRIYDEIAAGFDDFTQGKPPTTRLQLTPHTRDNIAELTLIDDREFEEWLWASATVARLETAHEEEIFNLNQRLASVQGQAVDNESNPVGAAAICHAFHGLIRQFDIGDNVRKVVIDTFQQAVEERFGPLVAEFNNHLIERGILPEVKRDMKIVRLGQGSERETVKAHTIEEAAAAYNRSGKTSDTTVAPSGAAPASRHAPGDRRGGATERAAISGLAHVRNLLRTGNPTPSAATASAPVDTALSQSNASSGQRGAAHVTNEAAAWYGTSELTTALNSIEERISTIRATRNKGDSILAQLKESLASIGGDPHKAIPVAQQESIEVIDNLMGSVHEDPIVAPAVRPWLEQLEVPLLKTAIRDETLIENRDHPATKFLNRLDMIGNSLASQESDRAQTVRNEISTLIDQVKEKSNSDDPAFDQALNRLEDLHDSMRRQYEASVADLVSHCDEEYLVESKRDELINFLDDYFGGERLPTIVFELLDAGWKNLLLRSFVREGADGRIFRRFLEVIDQTIARLTGDKQRISSKPWPESILLELIPRGLRQVPVDEAQIERLMAKLQPQFAMASVDPGSLTLKEMPRISALAEEKRRRKKEASIATLNVTPERWNKAEDSIRSMQSGDMISLLDAHGRKASHKLVWVAPNQSRFVFVDGEGHRSSDLPLNTLASLLLEEKATILEGWDVPLMDRATYSMLLAIHNNLLSQSNTDALTGLQNRRAFELELEKVLERTRIDKTKNILCYLDLDHFSLVNSLCKHEEGDRLLWEVADLLRQYAPAKAMIGRMGGDEFALVMPDMSRTEGMIAVRTIQQAMQAHKFRCKNHSHSLTASVGLVEINESSESGSRLMTAVETACRTAKENGRNRLEIHHKANDQIAAREGLIDMAGKIDAALRNNRLQLVCQRILPITQRDIEQAPYYEVLLRVQDANGQPIPHAQFIQAAEMYNRILDVDRWVIDNVVEWLEQRMAAGKPLPIFSVNLSGRSVNNKEFMDIIAERLIKCAIPHSHLCFEITETAAIGDMGQATHFIRRFKRIGCNFSLDDFGTGASSYSYLKALPVDYIKIDGSYVRNCHQQPHDLAVIKSINELGHAMGKKTIAEFVENEDILTLLHEIGVDYAQGYGIEKPVPIAQLN